MRLNILGRGFITVALVLALSACSTVTWQQLLYDVGDNYACQRAGTNLRDAKARAAQCAVDSHPDSLRYEDYKAARDQIVAPRP